MSNIIKFPTRKDELWQLFENTIKQLLRESQATDEMIDHITRMKIFKPYLYAIFLLLLFCSPLYAQESTPEKMSLPTPIPYSTPKEGYFWGWFLEKGWEQVKLGTVPPTHKILKESMPIPPKGYIWGWDEAQMRYVWLKIKDGNLVIQRIKYKDRLGNWYWKEATISLPSPVELLD